MIGFANDRYSIKKSIKKSRKKSY